MSFKYILTTFSILVSVSSFALEQIGDEELSSVSGKNGVYLSGELDFNENGGPLSLGDTGNESAVWGTCDDVGNGLADRCGARMAIELNDSGGWVAYDEIKGKISFEGLTLRSREITATDNFGGDEVAAAGKTVLEIGLPEKLEFENFSYDLTTSNHGRPTDAGYSQQTRYGIDFNGSVQLEGNLLVFPAGNP
jgi:hypothetical protein